MLGIFEQVGFDCEVPLKCTWDSLPITRTALADAFNALPDEELLVSGFDVVLRRKANS
jgi:hypothetical protein